ncbi:MAG: hypothetical protein K2N72_10855 [Oscillospiraceae bacterium]|nr:hypothetical protein [Oscillospiraceae bacterium]
MMKTIREIKGEAVERLKSCWAESVMISLLELGIYCLTYTVLLLTARVMGVHTANNVILIPEKFSLPFVISVIVILAVQYIATIPLYFGIRWFFWQNSTGKDVMPVSSVFACYGSQETRSKCFRIKLATDVRKLGWAILFGALVCAELFLADIIWQYSAKGEDVRIGLLAGCIIMAVGAWVFYMICTIKYIPAGYMMAANPYAAAGEIITLCKRTSKQRYVYILKMYAGNIRHAPLIIFIFPILVLRPYMLMTTAVSVRDSLGEIDGADINVSAEKDTDRK